MGGSWAGGELANRRLKPLGHLSVVLHQQLTDLTPPCQAVRQHYQELRTATFRCRSGVEGSGRGARLCGGRNFARRSLAGVEGSKPQRGVGRRTEENTKLQTWETGGERAQRAGRRDRWGLKPGRGWAVAVATRSGGVAGRFRASWDGSGGTTWSAGGRRRKTRRSRYRGSR